MTMVTKYAILLMTMYLYERNANKGNSYYYFYHSVWDKQSKKFKKLRIYLGRYPVLTEKVEKQITEIYGCIPKNIRHFFSSLGLPEVVKIDVELMRKLFTDLYFLDEQFKDEVIGDRIGKARHICAQLTKRKQDRMGRLRVKRMELEYMQNLIEPLQTVDISEKLKLPQCQPITRHPLFG